jgi:two-component system chemotaxis response regulator CheY
MKCLIAEDEISIQEVLLKMLTDDFECTAVTNGKDAVGAVLEAIKDQTPYDLICLDIQMPEADGQEALRDIRQLERDHGFTEQTRAKVIMTTVHQNSKNIMQAAKGGCDAYMVKPFSKDELFAEIEKFDFGLAKQTGKTTLLEKISHFLK